MRGIPTSSSRSPARLRASLSERLVARRAAPTAQAVDRVEGVHRALEGRSRSRASGAPQGGVGLLDEVDAGAGRSRRRSVRLRAAGRISDRAVVVLPQPDSPAIPSASPDSRVNDTPSTARTVPLEAEVGFQVLDEERAAGRRALAGAGLAGGCDPGGGGRSAGSRAGPTSSSASGSGVTDGPFIGCPASRVEHLVERRPEREREDDEHDACPGRHEIPPRTESGWTSRI